MRRVPVRKENATRAARFHLLPPINECRIELTVLYHHHIAGDLCCDVEREKNGEAVVVLQAMELEIGFQMIQSRIANVGTVEEA
jgi:hypothetical protein